MDPISAGSGAAVAIALGAMGYLYKLARRSPGAPVPSDRLRDVAQQLQNVVVKVNDLHDWHAIEDQDGVKRWYNKASSEKAIRDTATNSARAVELLAELLKETKRRGSERPQRF